MSCKATVIGSTYAKILVLWLVLAGLVASGALADDTAVSNARDKKIEAMTVSQYLVECQNTPDECVKDSKGVEENLTTQSDFEMMASSKPPTYDFCPPDQMTDGQYRDVLIAYFRAHQELVADGLIDGAGKAFAAEWGQRCVDEQKKHATEDAAKAAVVAQNTVGQYLAICQSDVAACDTLTKDATGEIMDDIFRELLNDVRAVRAAPPQAFCSPRLSIAAQRQAIVGYLGAHSELAAQPLLNGVRAAMTGLWPSHDGNC